MVGAKKFVLKLIFTFLVSIIFILVRQVNVLAQETNDGGIPTAEIVITKVRTISLPKADRNFDKVPPRQAEVVKHDFTYQLKSITFNSPDYNPIIRPLKLKDQEITKIYGNYISAGFGNYTSPYLEGFVNSKRDRNKFFGAHLYHRSFGSGAIDEGNSASGRTDLDVKGKFMTQNAKIGANLNYENIAGNYYGYVPQKTVKTDTIQQHYTRIGADFDIANLSTTKLDYKTNVGVGLLTDNYSAKESEVSINTAFDYKLEELSKLKLGIDYVLLTRADGKINSYSRNIFKAKPTYQFSPYDNLTLALGVNLAFQNDGLLNTSSFNLFPNFNAGYKINENSLAYAGLTGDIDKVSLRTISTENFWIQSNQKIINTNRAFEFSTGIKGKIAEKFSYNTGFLFASLKDYYFYQSDPSNRAKFDITYENGSTKRTNLFAEMGYHQEAVKLNLRGDYFGYSRESGTTAYQRPTYKILFNSYFNIFNKVLLNADFIALGGMKALDNQTSKVTDIPAALDVSIKANYLISKNATVFIKADNLLGSNYQLYLNYPTRGIQAMVGASCSF